MIDIISFYREKLLQLCQKIDEQFELAYFKVNHPHKQHWRELLKYCDSFLIWRRSKPSESDILFTHLHLPFGNDGFKNCLLEFLVIRGYLEGPSSDLPGINHFEAHIKRSTTTLSDSRIPEKASLRNGGPNKVYKVWKAERAHMRKQVEFLRSANSDLGYLPQVIFNIGSGEEDLLSERCISEWYSKPLDKQSIQLERSYVLTNSELSGRNLFSKMDDHQLLDNLHRVVVFDPDGRKQYRDQNLRILQELKGYEIPITELLVITFERKHPRISRLLRKLHDTYATYATLPAGMSYFNSLVVTRQEYGLLTRNTHDPTIEWHGSARETFQEYIDLTKNLQLHGLRSIQMLNIFNCCCTPLFRDRILYLLFEADEKSLLREEDKEQLNILDPLERAQLQTELEFLLTFAINDWQTLGKRIEELCSKEKAALVLPLQILNDPYFLAQIRSIMGRNNYSFHSWQSVRDQTIEESNVIILAYRDAGPYPFEFYPNILEQPLNEKYNVRFLLSGMFFEERFAFSTNKYYNTWHKINSSPFRDQNLDWKALGLHIRAITVGANSEPLNDDEQDRDMTVTADSIRVRYVDGGHSAFYPSRQLIASRSGHSGYVIIRAAVLAESTSDILAIQPLDEMYTGLNLFHITKEEEQELRMIQERYGLSGSTGQGLWKELLVRKAVLLGGATPLYDEVKQALGAERTFIQLGHFRDNWMDTKSDLLIPRSRRHFKGLCNYLDLPQAYYRLMLKRRAAQRLNSRQSKGQMNALLSYLILNGYFGDDPSWDKKEIGDMVEQYDLEELGITAGNAASELSSLVLLLRPEIKLRPINRQDHDNTKKR